MPDGVELGITAAELKSRRPNAEPLIWLSEPREPGPNTPWSEETDSAEEGVDKLYFGYVFKDGKCISVATEFDLRWSDSLALRDKYLSHYIAGLGGDSTRMLSDAGKLSPALKSPCLLWKRDATFVALIVTPEFPGLVPDQGMLQVTVGYLEVLDTLQLRDYVAEEHRLLFHGLERFLHVQPAVDTADGSAPPVPSAPGSTDSGTVQRVATGRGMLTLAVVICLSALAVGLLIGFLLGSRRVTSRTPSAFEDSQT